MIIEEEASSIVSNNSSLITRPNKKARTTESSSTAVTKYKGVVPQQNGRWGAQIYANHQRIWLGTFKSEKEAAMAYDSAAIKIRSGDTHRNVPWTDVNNKEPIFQNQFTTEAILNMIRDGSYQPKFADFVRTNSQLEDSNGGNINNNNVDQVMVCGDRRYKCRAMFQKELTPSDVGKLNRLVIPKKYAVKYFPYISENDGEDGGCGGGGEDTELVFCDKTMRTWKFRYCFWRSSQSFVFTRGWNRFVKENDLKEKDIVSFYYCECGKGDQSFFLIDVIQMNCGKVELGKSLGRGWDRDRDRGMDRGRDSVLMYKEEVGGGNDKVGDEGGIRLFGVQIK